LMKKYKYVAILMAGCLMLTACGSNSSDSDESNPQDTVVSEGESVQALPPEMPSDVNSDSEAFTGSLIDKDDMFSDRDLSGEYNESECIVITLSDNGSISDGKGVKIDGNTITITKEGDYILSGSLSDGMVIVDVDDSDKVQLVLNGVQINSAASAAIYVKKADKVFVTLADGTDNKLSNGGEFDSIDDNNIDAVIFSKDDLTLNGKGTLTINSPSGHGVVSKDDLVITNGTYNVTAASHGFDGKDSVAIANGTFKVTAGKDGFHSEDEDDDEKGLIYIENGEFNLSVESDGMSAVNEIYVADGYIKVEKSYEGLEARIVNICGGAVDITSSDDGLNATDKRSTASTKSTGKDPMGDTQSDANVNISGGIVYINAEGDGIDSNGYLTVSGGEVYVTGPSNGGNGALDYGIEATITGGKVVAAGQSTMAVNFGSNSTQGAMLVNTSSQNEAGTEIVLTDSEGNKLIEWTMDKSYNCVVISCPEIVDGATYTVTMGDNSTEVTMDGLIYGSGFGMGGGGFGGGRGNGQRPDQKPDDFKPEDNGQEAPTDFDPGDFNPGENGQEPPTDMDPGDFNPGENGQQPPDNNNHDNNNHDNDNHDNDNHDKNHN
jgi:hypothetical protein